MNAYVLLAIVGGTLGIVPILWKAKGVYVFMLLCAGNLLSAAVSGPLTNELRDLMKNESLPLPSIVKGTLLLLPPVLALIITRGSVKKKRAPYHLIGSLAAGILGFLWFMRVLPFEQFSLLENAEVTKQLMQLRDPALGAGILAALLLLFVERPKPEDELKKGRKGKKHRKH